MNRVVDNTSVKSEGRVDGVDQASTRREHLVRDGLLLVEEPRGPFHNGQIRQLESERLIRTVDGPCCRGRGQVLGSTRHCRQLQGVLHHRNVGQRIGELLGERGTPAGSYGLGQDGDRKHSGRSSTSADRGSNQQTGTPRILNHVQNVVGRRRIIELNRLVGLHRIIKCRVEI